MKPLNNTLIYIFKSYEKLINNLLIYKCWEKFYAYKYFLMMIYILYFMR